MALPPGVSPIPLKAMARAVGFRRDRAVFPPISPPMAIEAELYAIYNDSLKLWAALLPRIVEQYSPNGLTDSITTDADGQQLQWLVDQVKRQQDNTILYQTEKLGRWVSRVGKWHGQRTISAAKSALGVNIEPYIRLEDARPFLEQSIRRNVALISNLNADMQNRVEQVIFDGLANRRNKKWMTDELAKAMGITKRRARIIAGDQTHKLNIALTQFRNEQLGITGYIWRTRLDPAVRPAHRVREGKTFLWTKPPADGHPGFPIACRCSAASIVEFD